LPYQVRVAPAAIRAIEKLSVRVQHDVVDRLAELALDPRPSDTRKLQGFPSRDQVHRVPVAGTFRIIYQVREADLVVLVAKVADRKDVYKRLEDVKRIIKRDV
jgi:mRNA interferase RelE/StbE